MKKRLISVADIDKEVEEYEKQMDAVFVYDPQYGCIILNIAYPYEIELERIKDSNDLIHWIHHLCEKTWMDTDYLSEFIERVYKIKGWNLHESDY